MCTGVEAVGFQVWTILPADTKKTGAYINPPNLFTHCGPGRVSSCLKQIESDMKNEVSVFSNVYSLGLLTE